MACVWGVCLWSWCFRSLTGQGGQREGPGAAAPGRIVGVPCPALPSKAPVSPSRWFPVAAAGGSFPRATSPGLDHSTCPPCLKLLRRWEVRGRRPRQPVRLGIGPGCQWWQSLTLPLVFSVPEYLHVCVAASVSMSPGRCSVCLWAWLCTCGSLCLGLPPSLAFSSQ